eukprot:2533668-Rhodomonas_salina.2
MIPSFKRQGSQSIFKGPEINTCLGCILSERSEHRYPCSARLHVLTGQQWCPQTKSMDYTSRAWHTRSCNHDAPTECSPSIIRHASHTPEREDSLAGLRPIALGALVL